MNHMNLITNRARDYAWGSPGGISRLLGSAPTTTPEAELWLGAHAGSPSSSVESDAPWRDLQEWEQTSGQQLPFLLKLLSAALPLSIQAHPTELQAALGYAREEKMGIPRDAPDRNYRDAHAKPELIVAVEDGFEALCGFRDPQETVTEFDSLLSAGCGVEVAPLRDLLAGDDPLRRAVSWLLSGDPAARQAATELTRFSLLHPERLPVLARISGEYPGDPGVAVALMTNHVTLRAGEGLWLPAGNIHAYLRGNGVELMGPSDNVLRGGLTQKHIDVAELQKVLDFTPIRSSRIYPERVADNVVTYRPAGLKSGRDVAFQLLLATGDSELVLDAEAIALCLRGEFSLEAQTSSLEMVRGAAAFLETRGTLRLVGTGELFVAVGMAELPGTGVSPSSPGQRER